MQGTTKEVAKKYSNYVLTKLNFKDNLQTAKRKSPKNRKTCLKGTLGEAARPTS
jgi:hypothetical protein